MKMKLKGAILSAALALGVTGASTAFAAWEPTKPVEFIIPAGPGGGADQMARMIQGIITKNNLMKQAIIPVNKGAGAGAEPTASAVIADLVDVARMQNASVEQRVPYLAYHNIDETAKLPVLPISEISSAYYLRMRALDKPGVLADVTKILGDRQISIDAMMQKEPQDNETEADIVILTHITVEKNMDAAITAIEALAAIDGEVTKLRMEELNK